LSAAKRLKLDLPPELIDCLFLDVESSGLHAASYPIEIGWCGPDLLPVSFLIGPPVHWAEDDWSIISERIHGISRQATITDGIDAGEAAVRLNAACAGKVVASDRPPFDQAWLARLFEAAGIDQTFVLRDTAPLVQRAAMLSGLDASEVEALQKRVDRCYPHLHRAAADARRAAAMFVALARPDEIDAVLAVA
jgi:hypothetical protein